MIIIIMIIITILVIKLFIDGFKQALQLTSSVTIRQNSKLSKIDQENTKRHSLKSQIDIYNAFLKPFSTEIGSWRRCDLTRSALLLQGEKLLAESYKSKCPFLQPINFTQIFCLNSNTQTGRQQINSDIIRELNGSVKVRYNLTRSSMCIYNN